MTLSSARRGDGDARQLGRADDQRVEAEVDARRDDAALIGASEIDHVEGRRGAEIDDDQVALMSGVRGDGVERAVGADALRLGDVERDRPSGLALPGDQRLHAEIFFASTSRLCSARGTTVAMMTWVTSLR